MRFTRGEISIKSPPSFTVHIIFEGTKHHVPHDAIVPRWWYPLLLPLEGLWNLWGPNGIKVLTIKTVIYAKGWFLSCNVPSFALRVANRRISCPVSVAECSEGCLPIVHCLGDHRRPCCLFNNAISVDSFAPCIIISSYMCGGDMTPNNIHWLLIMQINGVEIEGKDVATHGLRGPHISVDDNWYAYWSITEFVWGGGYVLQWRN